MFDWNFLIISLMRSFFKDWLGLLITRNPVAPLKMNEASFMHLTEEDITPIIFRAIIYLTTFPISSCVAVGVSTFLVVAAEPIPTTEAVANSVAIGAR